MDTKDLANLIKETARLQEESWNSKKYNLTLREAIIAASVPNEWSEIVFLLLVLCWNDALAWAEEQSRK